MRFSWLCALLLGAAVLLPLSACDNSSTVGLGVGPDSLKGGDPVTLNIPPALDTTITPLRTGRELRSQPGPGQQQTWRVLAGQVEDPIGGTIETDGYFDILGRGALPALIRNAEADSVSAQLRLRKTYLHGYKGTPVELRVLNLAEEAPTDKMNGARADTSFSAGSVIKTASIPPTDTTVTIDLPQSWLTQEIPGTGGRTHLSVLQDTSDEFQKDFYGFKLAATGGGNAVLGFSSTDVSLRLTHLRDSTTVEYPAFKTFTHIERRNVPPPPGDHVVLQGGVGVGLTMQWDYDSPPLDTLKATANAPAAPLNRAEIFVPADTATMSANDGEDCNTEEATDCFVRPRPAGYRLTAARTDTTVLSCSALNLRTESADRSICGVPILLRSAPGAALVPNDIAFSIFQQSLQNRIFSEYRLQIVDQKGGSGAAVRASLPNTLPVLIPRSETDEVSLPRAVLTVTPL